MVLRLARALRTGLQGPRKAGPLLSRCQIDEELDRLQIAHRIHADSLLQGNAHKQLLHRNLQLLAAERVRDLGNGYNIVWHVVRRDVVAQILFDLRLQGVGELHAVLEHDEERHIVSAVLHLDAYDQAIEHLRQRLHDAVDLAAAHPDPHAVDRRVGAPIDDRAATRRHLDPVAVPPHAWKLAEVALSVAPPIGDVPEVEGHGGHGLRNHQFADLIDKRSALLIKRLHTRAEQATLQLACAHGEQDRAAYKGRADVSPAADRSKP